MTRFRTVVLLGATLATGLMAGLFAAFSYAVMPGLVRTDDLTFVTAMQDINAAILNGWFALCFGGALLLAVAALLLHLGRGRGRPLRWIAAGLVLYVVVLAITMTINVPLNDQLAAAGTPDHIADLAGVRGDFEASWVRWNVVRAVVNTIAFGCLAWALMPAGTKATAGPGAGAGAGVPVGSVRS